MSLAAAAARNSDGIVSGSSGAGNPHLHDRASRPNDGSRIESHLYACRLPGSGKCDGRVEATRNRGSDCGATCAATCDPNHLGRCRDREVRIHACKGVNEGLTCRAAPTGNEIEANGACETVVATGDIVEVRVVGGTQTNVVNRRIDESERRLTVRCCLLIDQSQEARPHRRGETGSTEV